MDSNKNNLLEGSLYYTYEVENVTIKNLFKVFSEVKKEEGEIIPLKRGNIFLNPKAMSSQKNDILIFEIDLNEREFYLRSFRGFLYEDGTINGKIKYSLDAKLEDDIFNGIYQFRINGTLIVFGTLNSKGVKEEIFIEFKSAKKITKKKEVKKEPIKKSVKKKKVKKEPMKKKAKKKKVKKARG